MAEFSINGSTLGNALQSLLMCDEIIPGAMPSYQICREIFLFHPLGSKMTSGPVKKAQALPRIISVPNSPEEVVRDAFLEEWDAIGADTIIRNVMTQSRIYGIASLAVLVENEDSAKELDYKKLANQEIAFNVLDPLNTAGSLVLNQNPNAFDYQKHKSIAVNGQAYHRNKTVTVMNEEPIYIAYTQSAFGFVGRSVYQRALFPLKSYIQTMVADDLLALKVGLLIAKLKPPGSIADRVMSVMMGVKRALLKEAQTGQVLSINIDEAIESLNLQNMNGSLVTARKDILENVAASSDMPAKLLNNETFAEGFGEGTEDAKAVAEYANTIRRDMLPLYRFMDRIVQHRAWNKRFYETIQSKFSDEYGGISYESAFYRWMNSFKAEWPSLLQEPESEQIKVEQVKYQTVVSTAQVLLPEVDPENKASVIEWMQDNINENTKLFTSPLNLDFDALKNYTPPQGEEGGLEEPKPGKPHISAGDAESAPVEGRVKKIEDFLRGRRHVDA